MGIGREALPHTALVKQMTAVGQHELRAAQLSDGLNMSAQAQLIHRLVCTAGLVAARCLAAPLEEFRKRRRPCETAAPVSDVCEP